MDSRKPIRVLFIDIALKEAVLKLEQGSFEEKRLATWIRNAIDELSTNSTIGIKIPTKLWPKEYVQKYAITNLWKLNLPAGWRMIVTKRHAETEILSIILEWVDHSAYERRFGY